MKEPEEALYRAKDILKMKQLQLMHIEDFSKSEHNLGSQYIFTINAVNSHSIQDTKTGPNGQEFSFHIPYTPLTLSQHWWFIHDNWELQPLAWGEWLCRHLTMKCLRCHKCRANCQHYRSDWRNTTPSSVTLESRTFPCFNVSWIHHQPDMQRLYATACVEMSVLNALWWIEVELREVHLWEPCATHALSWHPGLHCVVFKHGFPHWFTYVLTKLSFALRLLYLVNHSSIMTA